MVRADAEKSIVAKELKKVCTDLSSHRDNIMNELDRLKSAHD